MCSFVVAAGSSPWLPARCWSTGATSSHSERSHALLGAADKGKGPLEGPFSTFVESVSLSSTASRRPSVGSSWSLLFETSS